MTEKKLTKLQHVVQEAVKSGQSVWLVAPTGIGKTLAVSQDFTQTRRRTVYAVPLRALASTILDEVTALQRDGTRINAVTHHGDVRESWLLSEEVVITTYDQVVCGVPGLPLSLPMSAGHAVAGALLMSTLVLDEVHLAWSISQDALTILFAIIDFRQKLGLQTIVMTATMPEDVAKQIANRLGMKLIIAGNGETVSDEGLAARKANRMVRLSEIKVKDRRSDEKSVDLAEVAEVLRAHSGKRIYFANTVQRLQSVYDVLGKADFDMKHVTILHNRMPGSWRLEREATVRERFGKDACDGDWLLLTNQVAEAGLDISAPLVLSDPAPVDTLIQRAGRCARWFRFGKTEGRFQVIAPPKNKIKDWAFPYSETSVLLSLEKLRKQVLNASAEANLDWDTERKWIDAAWLSDDSGKHREARVEKCLNRTTFALNLFDRASQQHSPGTIAKSFREILSIQVAVVDEAGEGTDGELLAKLRAGYDLNPSSVSLKSGYGLITKAREGARVVCYRDEFVIERNPSFLIPGDLLLVPSSAAYLHRAKGLCFGDGSQSGEPVLTNKPVAPSREVKRPPINANPQSLWKHTSGVMQRVRERLLGAGDYRSALVKILTCLEGQERAESLADSIGRLAVLATGFHDIGKCGRRWQKRAHEIDPDSKEVLIGRTKNAAKSIGIPHTPPGFFAAMAACKAAIGDLPETDYLVRAVSLAAARHHSSLLNPSAVPGYRFDPLEATLGFVEQVLSEEGLKDVSPRCIIEAACSNGTPAQVPLMLPNDDLFPIYALVGRAILVSDREDAAGQSLERWSASA